MCPLSISLGYSFCFIQFYLCGTKIETEPFCVHLWPSFIPCFSSSDSNRPAADIIGVEIRAPEHHSAFGPCVDGIVVAREPHVLMEEHAAAQFKSFDVMFGVTSIEVSINLFGRDRQTLNMGNLFIATPIITERVVSGQRDEFSVMGRKKRKLCGLFINVTLAARMSVPS